MGGAFWALPRHLNNFIDARATTFRATRGAIAGADRSPHEGFPFDFQSLGLGELWSATRLFQPFGPKEKKTENEFPLPLGATGLKSPKWSRNMATNTFLLLHISTCFLVRNSAPRAKNMYPLPPFPQTPSWPLRAHTTPPPYPRIPPPL